MLFFTEFCNACTGFGAITESGTIIGRNRDYYYIPQKFQLVYPIQQFNNWHGNNYHHHNKFYALISKNNISMGVNQNGLSIIEEDSPLPPNAKNNRRFQPSENGAQEGMIKYGILQNFNTIDELIPFLTRIFSSADPQFYQISDAKKILTVEVAYGDSNTDIKRKFTYNILFKKNDYFAHTNTYLNQQFSSLNHFRFDQHFFNSSNARLQRINYLLSHARSLNTDVASHWLLDTHSNFSCKMNKNECLNTSLFRSDLQGLKSVNLDNSNDKICGTVSSMIIENKGNLEKSSIYLTMIDSITTGTKNNQLIKYKLLHTSLKKLFLDSKPIFFEREFIRNEDN